jgi:peptidoglycan/xylan/chitin deacetylase (PgdA/CDA1 family)
MKGKDFISKLIATERVVIRRPFIAVLAYHSVSGGNDSVDIKLSDFERQIDYLVGKNYKVGSLSEVMEMTEKSVLERPVVGISFDDGYSDLLDTALPVLAKHNLKATFFVLSRPGKADRSQINNSKSLLDNNGVRMILSEGHEIGSHTSTHPNLLDLRMDRLREEIIDSKYELEKEFGGKVKYFAYPKGKYDQRSSRLCREAGYEAAFSACPGFVGKNIGLYEIPRILIDRYHGIDQFQALLTVCGSSYQKLKTRRSRK